MGALQFDPAKRQWTVGIYYYGSSKALSRPAEVLCPLKAHTQAEDVGIESDIWKLHPGI